MTIGQHLLERDQELAALGRAMDAAVSGQGSLILLSGEAGVGKTALVRGFAATLEGIQIVTGICDPLPTPHALGPLLDIAPGLGFSLEHLLEGSRSGRDVYAAVFSHLSGLTAPAVLVFEDLHWADQASLELVGFLGRRVDRLRALIIATLREEEIDSGGGLAVMLGDLATAPGVRRLPLRPLSREATSELAQGSSTDVEELYRMTGGNAFFVTEVLAASSQDVPRTVRDAVLVRVARRSREGRRALEIAAAIGVRVDPGLLTRVMEATGTPGWSVEEAVDAGLLEWQGPWLAFRHELAQAAIARGTSPELRRRLHASILAELRGRVVRPDDYAILAGHAEAAGDDPAVLELAPLAAARAAQLGAHREAAQLYGKALERSRHRPALTAELFERRGTERYLNRRLAAAMDDHRLAADLYRDLGDHLGEARNLIRFSYLSSAAGDPVASETTLSTATGLLEQLPPSRELAIAYEARGRRLFVSNQPGPAEAWAEQAVALAKRLGDAELSLESGVTAAVARLLTGDEAARVRLRGLRDAARERSLHEAWAQDAVARINFYLALVPMLRRSYTDVDRYLQEGWQYALDNDLEYWQSLMAGARVLRSLDAGRWDEATQQAEDILAMADPVWRSNLLVLISLARIKARRGRPDAATYLEQATQVARRDRAFEGVIWPARAEAAWLAGEHARVHEVASEARARGIGKGDPWAEGELAFWAHLAGGVVDGHAITAEPYRLAILGSWAAAAKWWEEQGCPYEMSITLSTGDEPDSLRRAISALDQLGSTPAAAHARRRLRELGVTSVPRGPRPSTRANPAGLTGRELEVLELVAAGLSNADIATRLFLSEKTVERHMAGIFAKLNVTSRVQAVRAGARAGAVRDAEIEGQQSSS